MKSAAHKQRQLRSRALLTGSCCWGLALVIAAACVCVIWLFLWPRTQETATPVSREDAKGCPIPLPPSAQNVQYQVFRQWIVYRELVRFDAPVQDCVNYIDQVYKHARSRFGAPAFEYSSIPQEMRVPDEYLQFLRKRVPQWFDVWNIRKGLQTTAGGGYCPRVWIDTERGTFFYMLTD